MKAHDALSRIAYDARRKAPRPDGWPTLDDDIETVTAAFEARCLHGCFVSDTEADHDEQGIETDLCVRCGTALEEHSGRRLRSNPEICLECSWKRDGCVICGGAILADTEDWAEPLCPTHVDVEYRITPLGLERLRRMEDE